MSKIRVLVVDDSAMIRKLVSEILSSDKEIEVIGTAADPFLARAKIKALNPDVLTLDVEMPRMDGITFLKNLMRLRPMPVVMLSTLTAKGSDATLEALATGAIDFVFKPVSGVGDLKRCSEELIAKVKNAALANTKWAVPSSESEYKASASNITVKSLSGDVRMIAVGASTGGTEAIREVLMKLPDFAPPLVIAQHIPKEFSRPFAERMDSVAAMKVKEAEHGEPIRQGHVYLAPGSHHLTVKKYGISDYQCCLDLNEPVNRHRPSVDVLFDSVREQVGHHAVGILLTGMGKDGALGLARMRQSGCSTIAQDERSSVVWGMPGEAVKIGAAEHVVSLQRVAEKILYLASSDSSGNSRLALNS